MERCQKEFAMEAELTKVADKSDPLSPDCTLLKFKKHSRALSSSLSPWLNLSTPQFDYGCTLAINQ